MKYKLLQHFYAPYGAGRYRKMMDMKLAIDAILPRDSESKETFLQQLAGICRFEEPGVHIGANAAACPHLSLYHNGTRDIYKVLSDLMDIPLLQIEIWENQRIKELGDS